ncbi:chitooligosaccharidolytic beta-N-acetylglucosaminidase isoform X2 [Bacillus rossius redtenbacheri]
MVARGRFLASLEAACGGNCSLAADTAALVVRLAVDSPSLALDWATDESYSLQVAARGSQVTAQVRAATGFGARHGLETLAQLVAATGRPARLLMAGEARVADRPAFPHRGLLLDTARNFLPLADLRRTVGAMAACKLNVLHWHATDSQSFPLESEHVPQLARHGAYSARETYSARDQAELVRYARARGVRVLLEVDAPSHAGNGWQWGPAEGLGALAVCVNRQPWRSFCIQPPCGQLNPANPRLYGVLGELYRDLLGRWPAGEVFHMGGDEVFFACWNKSAEVVGWMESRGLGRSQADFLQVWGEFQERALQEFDKAAGHLNNSIVMWSSQLTQPGVIQNYLSKERYVIETWVEADDPLPRALMALGYRLILAVKDAWYLDHGFWGRTRYHDWRAVYDTRLPGDRAVLGGEAAMWSELVDGAALDARVWPRAAALAERLWSDPAEPSARAEPRLHAQRERLVRRGVRADALAPAWCVHNEGECR